MHIILINGCGCVATKKKHDTSTKKNDTSSTNWPKYVNCLLYLIFCKHFLRFLKLKPTHIQTYVHMYVCV